MTWGALHGWYLLLLVPIAMVLAWWFRHRMWHQQASLGYGNAELRAGWRAGTARLRQVLWFVGLICVAVAALQPRWGEDQRQRDGEGVDIVVLLDCSRSMLAEDIYPNRLEVARRKVTDLLRLAPEHRVALVPFAADAVLRAPLTGDATALTMLLEQCSPALFPRQGTAIGDAVSYAVDFLGGQGERGQAILICSDGDDPIAERVEKGLMAATNAGIPVYGLFMGDETQTALISIDGRDQEVSSSRETLNTYAEKTGGVALNTSLDDQDVSILLDHMTRHIATRPWQEMERVIASERYQWVLLPGIACFVLALCMGTARRRSKDQVADHPGRSSRAQVSGVQS